MLGERLLGGKNEFLEREKQVGGRTSESGPGFDNNKGAA